jgi:hypothetical protein
MTEENRATSLTQQTSVAQRLMQNRRDKELSIEQKRKEHELQLRLEKEKAEILREENLENNERLERADIFKR